MQNSGFTIVAQTLHMSSVKDRNPIYYQSSDPRLSERYSLERERFTWEEKREKRAFQEQRALGLILELEKRMNMDNVEMNERIDECLHLRFMQMDLNRLVYEDETFILASQTQQVLMRTIINSHAKGSSGELCCIDYIQYRSL
ncbi:hypothetical protein Lal_00042444 [Lupinus albus]|nr:hypothetical protein Lal_00042444 [Lupinus albus]